MAQEWIEVLDKRTRTSKTKRMYEDDQPTRKFSWDGNLGLSMHYLDALGAWQDVDDSAEEPDDQGFSVKFTKLSYFVRVGDDGGRRFYPDRNDLSYWIEFKKPYPSMGAPTRQGRWFYWDFAHAVIGVRCDVDSLKFGFRLKDNLAPTSITIPFETQGITRQGRLLLHNGEVVAELRKPIATGSNLDEDGRPVQKECDVVFGPGEVTISLDPTGLQYPIDIDPTIDKQVAADADDGTRRGDGNFQTFYVRIGQSGGRTYDCFLRWIGVTIAGTIDVSYIELHHMLVGGTTPLMKIFGVDEDNPAAPTTGAEFAADPLTAAAVDWDVLFAGNWNQSPSLNTIFQELVDTYAITNEAVMVQVKDDGSANGHYNNPFDFFDDNTKAAKLHIEYSVGGEEYSLEIGAGSYALDGTAIGLPLGRVMAAAAGSYAVDGAAVGLLRDLLMGASPGSYTITGASVPFILGMAASPGAYNITGSDVDLLFGKILIAESGVYIIAGQDASFPVDLLISASPGAYVLSGSDVDLLRALVMDASGGTYTLTGANVGLLLGRLLTAGAGSYIVTGQDVSLPIAWVVAIDGGSYIVTGAAASLLADLTMQAGAGSYAVAGQDAVRQITMIAEAGAYLLSGMPVVWEEEGIWGKVSRWVDRMRR